MLIVSTKHIDVAAECIPTHQLLNVAGERVPDRELDHYVAKLTESDLADFLRDMVVLRRLDNEATALQRQEDGEGRLFKEVVKERVGTDTGGAGRELLGVG